MASAFARPLVLFVCATAALVAADPAATPRFTPEVEEFVKNFKPGGMDFTGQTQPLDATAALRRLQPAEGYQVELVAHEPAIRQPIDMHFDDRGRLWVVQYLQYPFPAGLTVTHYDQYLRAEFNRMPPPPPRHFRGADRITILEDRDANGSFEHAKTFLDGLNMAISVAPTHDGAWVLMPPYLLFYADRDGDDVPDGDPEVHLTGFGLEDTHSLASSLHFGPDGWLYGAKGSTTNLEIQGIRLLGQGIWRYHPGTKVFEIFAEGGGNTMSFEMDRFGRAYSGTNNGATRGLHYAQGATYVKGWTKHGPAMNPFIFGFFEHMAHQGYSQRFPQAFLFYEGGVLPALEGQIVVGMAMTNRVQASAVHADTSTFRTVDSVAVVTTDDKTFRPVDIEGGPDGAIYVADWTDVRLSHLNPKDTWDKTNGRIIRIAPEGFVRPPAVNLRTASTEDLIGYLAHPNRYFRERARLLLAARPDKIAPALSAMLRRNNESALEALWVLNLRGEVDEPQLTHALGHPNEHVRRWAVRLLGDRNSVGAATAVALATLAAKEPAVEVRSQLASSARRLPAGQAFHIIRALLGRDEDVGDKHLPLLIWWAIEAKANTGREELLALTRDPAVWKTGIFSQHIAERIGQRFTADQGPRKYYTLKHGVYSGWQIERAPEHLHRNLEMTARLLAAAPGRRESALIVAGMAKGLTGGRVDTVPGQLLEILDQHWQEGTRSAALVTLAARLGRAEAMAEAVAQMKDGRAKAADQELYVDLFAATGEPSALPVIADLVRREKNEPRRTRLLSALTGFSQPAAADVVMEIYPTLPPRLQNTAQRMLSEKPAWALSMLQRMDQAGFNPGALSTANLALIRGHADPRLASALTSYQQKHSEDPKHRSAQLLFESGRTAYTLSCAPCHQEAGDGKTMLAPALVGSPWLQSRDETLVRIILHGKENPGRGLVMPPWRHLDDEQVAAVATYIRREFGHRAEAIEPATVSAVRSATSDRQKPWTDAELNQLVAK